MSMILSAMLASMALGDKPAPAAEEKKSELDQVVCKRFPPPAGTRIGARKVCATKREWALQEEEIDTNMDRVQSRTSLQGN